MYAHISRIKLYRGLLFLVFLLTAGISCCGTTAYAKKSLPSSYELKFLLDPNRVLDGENRIRQEYRDLFSFGSAQYQAIDVAYLETPDKAFFQEGWINRVRLKNPDQTQGGENRQERTYKKRYEVSGTDLNAVEAALADASKDGLTTAQGADVQIDWGYSDMTLSISFEPDEDSTQDAGPSQITEENLIPFVGQAMPEAEKNWKSDQWGINTLKSSVAAGPLRFLRLDGGSWETGNGQTIKKIRIEIWPVKDARTGRTDYITELSCKVKSKSFGSVQDTYRFAAEARTEIAAVLDEKRILLHRDSLKTTLILNAYLASSGSAPEGAADNAPGKDGNLPDKSVDNVSGDGSNASGTPSDSGSIGSPSDGGEAVPKMIAAGRKCTRGYYIITGAHTVTYALSRVGQKATTASVPGKIKIGRKYYRVNAVASDAFAGRKHLRRVFIGANVSGIGARAFSGCGRLKTLILGTSRLSRQTIRDCLSGSRIRTIQLIRKARKKYRDYRKIFTRPVTGASKRPQLLVVHAV